MLLGEKELYNIGGSIKNIIIITLLSTLHRFSKGCNTYIALKTNLSISRNTLSLPLQAILSIYIVRYNKYMFPLFVIIYFRGCLGLTSCYLVCQLHVI